MFLFYFLIIFISLYSQQSYKDSSYLHQLIGENISHYINDMNDGVWIIGGNNNEKIYYINKRKKVTDITAKTGLPHNLHFTSILPLRRNVALIGTEKNFVYCIHNRRFIQLNNSCGLNDSCIKDISWDKENKIVIVSSRSSRYSMLASKRKADFVFKEVTGSTTISPGSVSITSVAGFFRRPVQKAICMTASPVDYSFRRKKYISFRDIRSIKNNLKPGFILLRRNESQLTNLAIGDFWTHTGIYIGGKHEIDEYFDSIPLLKGEKPSEYLRTYYPDVYKKINRRRFLIIEAIGEGVAIQKLESMAKSDHFAAIETLLSKEDIFKSLLKAFDFYGIPYDFLFDFETDEYLFCSELVFKSFTPSLNKEGIVFTGDTTESKFFLSPNDIARNVCSESEKEHPNLRVKVFYSGSSSTAIQKDDAEFCKTCK